jgi:DNA polymerase-3 subunit delta'
MSVLFKDILGQEKLKAKLRESVNAERLAHTLMFSSEDGGAALSMALALSQYIHCENADEDACGVCSSCKQWANFSHPDVHFTFPFAKQESGHKVQKSSDLAEEWRSFLSETAYRTSYSWVLSNAADKKTLLIPKLEADALFNSIKYKSYLGGYKIGIIWQPEKLHATASNFLLKMLEEPKDKTLYILVTSKAQDILPTILSRVQHYRFLGNTVPEIQEYLSSKIGLGQAISETAAGLSSGSVGKAIAYAESIDGKANYFDDFVSWMRMCFAKDLEAINLFMEGQAQQGREVLKNFLIFCLEQFRKCLWLNTNAWALDDLPEKEQQFFVKFAPYIRLSRMGKYDMFFNAAIADILWNGNAKIILTDLSFKTMVLLKPKP